jgi:prevent-host-death family protein
MKSMSARDAKNGFGLLLDTARAEPVTIKKHGRPVVIVMSVEEYDRLASGRNAVTQPDIKIRNKKKQKMLKVAR